jgi:hypothetical protein
MCWPKEEKLMQQKIARFFSKYESTLQAALFVSGFLFDLLTLTNVDDLFTIVMQTFYLICLILLVSSELYYPNKEDWPKKLQKIIQYRSEVFHFILGALLSAFTIFYFKSASLANSFLFMTIMALLLLVNELPLFKRQGLMVRLTMLTLCLMSYYLFICAIVLKTTGIIVFILALVLTLLSISLWTKFVHQQLKTIYDKNILHFAIGPLLVVALFVILFFTRIIPPVPLSIQFIGIYHQVEREDGDYRLYHQRKWWRIWHRGDQIFNARPEDQPHVFFRLFSPGGFEESIIIHWRLWDEQQGWLTSDRIPLVVTGGREEGYRGFAFKRNFQPGLWQIKIETRHGLEIGRIGLEITQDLSQELRVFKSELQ